ncbi:hypothetical protein CFP65_3270 [Kitasatospora sp. MMS16-BH015]|uniref:hypothetical protein n=1 Tax=Kitasatospora sp. MMS16-BH015 TaxID=2018025 RepID=UPI000CA2FFD2|nr:hypothetical protein [Kitasatospora sp. MMS16-BH015]AUG78071.1 hypothetical protein CFP65_3270 [Kitasatospora sp. MMS16-BH015]
MNTDDHAARPAGTQTWPDPSDAQVSLVARILGPHIRKARAERLAAEQAAAGRPAVERVAA